MIQIFVILQQHILSQTILQHSQCLFKDFSCFKDGMGPLNNLKSWGYEDIHWIILWAWITFIKSSLHCGTKGMITHKLSHKVHLYKYSIMLKNKIIAYEHVRNICLLLQRSSRFWSVFLVNTRFTVWKMDYKAWNILRHFVFGIHQRLQLIALAAFLIHHYVSGLLVRFALLASIKINLNMTESLHHPCDPPCIHYVQYVLSSNVHFY